MDTVTVRPPLPRWVWVLIAVAVTAAVAAGVVLWAQRPTDTPSATSSSTPTPTPATASETVTGCLAEGQDINMLLTTQKEAPRTEVGAVEFATAALRWLYRSPWPSYEEVMLGATAITPDEDGAFSRGDYDAFVAGGNASDVVPDGTPFHLTSAIGSWYVDEFDGDTAKVSVVLTHVIGDAVSPLYQVVLTYNLVWKDGSWKQADTEKLHTVARINEIGAPFQEGC